MHPSRASRLLVLVGSLVALASVVAIAQTPPFVVDIFGDPVNEATKEEIIEEDRILEAIAEANPAPKEDPVAAQPSNDPGDLPVWEEGIFEGDADLPSGPGYTFTTIWQGTLGGMNVRVYAGGLTRDRSTGIILVDLVDPESWGHRFKGPFEAPIPGPLHVDGVEGKVLTLSGAKGTSVEFDLTRLAYVGS